MEEKILSLINFIRLPTIDKLPDLLVPNRKTKSKDWGAIGTHSDFLIKEILFSKYKPFAYKYDFYWDTDDLNIHDSSQVKKRRLNHYNTTQMKNHRKVVPKNADENEVPLKNIVEYLKKYYLYSYAFARISEEQILTIAKEISQIINIFNAEKFKPKEYIMINPWLGTKKIAGYFYKSGRLIPDIKHKMEELRSQPDLIVDDMLIDIKCHSVVKFTARDLFQLFNYLIWFEFSRQHLKFAKPVKKIGIYFSRHNYLFLVNLSDVFTNNSQKKILQLGKQLIQTGNFYPGPYIKSYYDKCKISRILSDITLWCIRDCDLIGLCPKGGNSLNPCRVGIDAKPVTLVGCALVGGNPNMYTRTLRQK
jgi:hypothetical protein